MKKIVLEFRNKICRDLFLLKNHNFIKNNNICLDDYTIWIKINYNNYNIKEIKQMLNNVDFTYMLINKNNDKIFIKKNKNIYKKNHNKITANGVFMLDKNKNLDDIYSEYRNLCDLVLYIDYFDV